MKFKYLFYFFWGKKKLESYGYLGLLERINSLFVKAGINTKTVRKINSEELYSAMQSDKKKKGKNLNFIILEEIGKAVKIDSLAKEKVQQSIEKSLFPR